MDINVNEWAPAFESQIQISGHRHKLYGGGNFGLDRLSLYVKSRVTIDIDHKYYTVFVIEMVTILK